MSHMAAGRRHSFDLLNGLRGVAAIAVTNMHLSHYMGGIQPAIISPAVDFFFVLSGFVIAHAYEGELRSGLGVKQFALARLIRLYPLYLLGLILGAMAIWIYERPPLEANFFTSVGLNLFMLPLPFAMDVSKKALFPLNFPVWSLFFELLVNIVYAVVLPYLSNRRLGVLIGAGFLGLVATGLTVSSLDQGVQRGGFLGGLARVTFCFFAGVALYRLWLSRPMTFQIHPVMLFVLLILPLMLKPEGSLLWLYELAVITIYMPLIVWLGSAATVRGVWLGICTALGALSYPLYVIHAPMWTAVRAYDGWKGNTFLHEHAPWSGLILICVLCAISWWLDKAVDHPLRRYLSGKLRGTR